MDEYHHFSADSFINTLDEVPNVRIPFLPVNRDNLWKGQ